MMHKRGEIENNICVNCKKNKVEKSSHILLCTNEKATEFYHKKVKEELKKELEKRHTSPILRETIIDILTKWRQRQTIDYNDYSQQYKIRDAVLEQKKNRVEQFCTWQILNKMANITRIILCRI